MKAAIHFGPNYVSNSEIYKNTKIEDIESVFNITQKLVKEHSEEILMVRCLEYSSPSWTRSILATDQAVKWAKSQVCVYTDSVMQWVSMEKQLNLSGKIFQGFRHCLFLKKSNKTLRSGRSSQRSSQTGSSSCQCSMTWYGKRMMRIVFRMPKKSRITPRSSYQDIGRFWVQDRKRSGMAIPTITRTVESHRETVELHRQQDSTAIQRDWSSYLQKFQCFESWNLEAKERQMDDSLQWRFCKYRTLVPNSSLCQSAPCLRNSCELVLLFRFDRRRNGTSQHSCGQQDFHKVETRRKYNSWYLLRHEQL